MMERIVRERKVFGVENVVGKFDFCTPCKLAKMTRHPHFAAVPDPDLHGPLNLVVMDLAGPNKPCTLGGVLMTWCS